jgi:hypothetical protein
MVVIVLAAVSGLLSANGKQSPASGWIHAQIRVAHVTGAVTVAHAQGIIAKLYNDDSLLPGDVVITAKESSAVLVFSSGSTVSIGPASKTVVAEFTQDPFPADVILGEAKEEPSWSQTELKLIYGELVGDVKKLKGPSTLLVQTPVGAAGIRGTTFRLLCRPAGHGQCFFALSVASGRVVFFPVTGMPIPVVSGQEMHMKVAINPTVGAVESEQPTSTNISDDTRQAIEQQAEQAVEALRAMIFCPSQDR